MNTLELDCIECGHVIVLDAEAQAKILRELTMPTHAKVLECPCGRTAYALGVRRQQRRLDRAA